MFALSEFYDYCRQNDIDVMPYDGMPKPAATIRDGRFYCVALDFTQLCTVRLLRGAAYHEIGHLHSGCLHKLDSPFQLVEQMEYRATVDSIQRYLTVDDLRGAIKSGYRETWELADYFDLPEDEIKEALHYWIECREIDFNISDKETS